MFDFTITPDGGEPFEMTAGMRDIVIWERTHKGRAFAQLGDGGMSATMLYEIAYSACRRQQLVPRELTEAQFVGTYDISLGDEPEEDEPTVEAPPPVDGEQGPVGDDPFAPFDAFGTATGRATVEQAPPQHAADEQGQAADPTRSGA